MAGGYDDVVSLEKMARKHADLQKIVSLALQMAALPESQWQSSLLSIQQVVNQRLDSFVKDRLLSLSAPLFRYLLEFLTFDEQDMYREISRFWNRICNQLLKRNRTNGTQKHASLEPQVTEAEQFQWVIDPTKRTRRDPIRLESWRSSSALRYESHTCTWRHRKVVEDPFFTIHEVVSDRLSDQLDVNVPRNPKPKIIDPFSANPIPSRNKRKWEISWTHVVVELIDHSKGVGLRWAKLDDTSSRNCLTIPDDYMWHLHNTFLIYYPLNAMCVNYVDLENNARQGIWVLSFRDFNMNHFHEIRDFLWTSSHVYRRIKLKLIPRVIIMKEPLHGRQRGHIVFDTDDFTIPNSPLEKSWSLMRSKMGLDSDCAPYPLDDFIISSCGEYLICTWSGTETDIWLVALFSVPKYAAQKPVLQDFLVFQDWVERVEFEAGYVTILMKHTLHAFRVMKRGETSVLRGCKRKH